MRRPCLYLWDGYLNRQYNKADIMKLVSLALALLVLSGSPGILSDKGMAAEVGVSLGEVAIELPNASTDSHHHYVSADVARQHVEERRYSLFMHHATGYLLLAIGILLAIDRSTYSRYRLLPYAIGSMWTLFGLFIFVRADPDGWPMGSGFWHSWTMPSHVEWLQHKLLSLIPLILAGYAFWRRPTEENGNRGLYVPIGLAVLGAAGLLMHRHLDHPGMDLVNIQHQLFAGTCLVIAVSLFQETRGRWLVNNKRLMFPALVIILALELTWYTE